MFKFYTDNYVDNYLAYIVQILFIFLHFIFTAALYSFYLLSIFF